MAAHADAQPRAHRAAIAVRGDDVARAHLALVPGVEVAQRDRRAVVVLIHGDRLGAVADRRAELERALAQQRLERVLVDEDADGGAEALDALVELLDVGGELAPRERLDRDDAARRAVGLQRLRAHPLLEPHLADHLHRAQLEVARARMDRRARVALHRQRRHAVVAEQHGRRQTHQAPADDQDRDLLVSHGATLDAPATMCQLNLVIRGIHRSNEPRRPRPQPARRARRPAQRAQRHAGGAARRAQPAGHEQRARPAAPALRRSAARPPGRDARAHRAGRGADRPGARGARAHPPRARRAGGLRPRDRPPFVPPELLGLQRADAHRPARARARGRGARARRRGPAAARRRRPGAAQRRRRPRHRAAGDHGRRRPRSRCACGTTAGNAASGRATRAWAGA